MYQIPNATIRKIRDRLKDGWTQRKIAGELHVSKSLICDVHTGKRSEKAERVPKVPEYEFVPRQVAPYWCAVCRVMVIYEPCVACVAREAKKRGGWETER